MNGNIEIITNSWIGILKELIRSGISVILIIISFALLGFGVIGILNSNNFFGPILIILGIALLVVTIYLHRRN